MTAVALTGPVGDTSGFVHALDPRAKVLGFLTVTCVAVSAPLHAWPAYAGCAVALAALAAAARVPPRIVWRRARIVLLPVLLVALLAPSNGLEVAAKATLGTVSAVLLAATTSYPDVLRALAALRVPRAFTLIAAFSYRYLFVVAEEASRMRAALSARGYRPRTALGAAATGRLAAALFLRSHGRGERVYLAMVARGYTGAMPEAEPLAFRRADALFLAGLAASLVALRIGVAL
jgi:cobalt/nickel transport system permease protein